MCQLEKIGFLKHKSSCECKNSRLGIGLEKLDRSLYDPTNVYDSISQIGVKWVRIQSGWFKTEKQKGIYDFKWLDEIVDNIISRGMTPWLCLCYGNELYTKNADNSTGSIPFAPINTQEEKTAWENYVAACVEHYKGKISLYEIWNEPDIHCWYPSPNPKEYGEFCIATAKAIKKADSQAKIIGCAMGNWLSYWYEAFKTGMLDYVDFVSYHRYKVEVETCDKDFLISLKSLIKTFTDRDIKLIEGETGTQSQRSPNGAVPDIDWDERKQAKYLLRKLTYDIGTDAYLVSYFSSVDIFENLKGAKISKEKSMYGFFGVLGEKFDENDMATGEYFKKPSYFAFQNLCSVFDGNETKTTFPFYFRTYDLNDIDASNEKSMVYKNSFQLNPSLKAIVYYKAADILSDDFESTVSLVAMGLSKNIHLIDLMTGGVYKIDGEHIEINGDIVAIKNIPIKDYPLLVTFGDISSLI